MAIYTNNSRDTSVKIPEDKMITGKVAAVNDDGTLVIDRGAHQGVACGQRYLVYSIGNEIFSPDTNVSLGHLEVVCGTGVVVHAQDNMATIESDRVNIAGGLFVKETREIVPFKNATIGCLIKHIG